MAKQETFGDPTLSHLKGKEKEPWNPVRYHKEAHTQTHTHTDTQCCLDLQEASPAVPSGQEPGQPRGGR